MPIELHWLRSEWLWALPLVVVLPWLCKNIQLKPKGWDQLIAGHLLQALAIEQSSKQHSWRWLFGVVLLVLIIALAGPSWQRLPQPAFNLKRGTVVLMDMSLSMHATDVKPDRLAQARFKAIDFANLQAEGDMALVSFAGDAFVITPLTPDHNNITLMIPMLKPEIMPVQGSDFLSALKMADKLLTQAGYTRGDVVAFTDGFPSSQATELRDYVDDYPHRLSIVAFGSAEGAPIKLEQGTLLKDNQGSIVIPRVPLEQLEQLATVTGGVFTAARYDKVDIETIAKLAPLDQASAKQRDERFQGEQWQDGAVWLLWLALPVIAWWLRRTPLLVVVLIGGVLIQSPSAQADEVPAAAPTPASTETSWLDQVSNYLWRTPSERAHQLYQQGDYQQAQQRFEDPTWQGNAAYRSGDYPLAEQLYRQSNDASSRYNLGNALAKQQKLPEALKAYEAAKQQKADLPGLEANIELVKQLIEKQKQQQQQSGQQQQSDQQQSSEQNQQQSQQQDQQQNSQQQTSSQQPNGESNQQSSNDQDGKGEQQQQQSQQGKPQQQAEMKVAEDQQTSQETKAVREAWPNATPEQTQQLDAILRKVQDDPYQLLHNKMVLEYQRRNAQAPQRGDQQEW
jgi:Ca-activated chloride channel family protein